MKFGGKVMFSEAYVSQSFCSMLEKGWGLPRCRDPLDTDPPWTQTPLDTDPLDTVPPSGHRPPFRTETPLLDTNPPNRDPP